MSSVQLNAATIDAIADAVAERLREPASNGRLVTVSELASQLNVSESVIYRRADELGALRIGGRLRFDPARAKAALIAPVERVKPRPATRRRPKRARSLQSRPKEPDGYYQARSLGP